MGRLVKIQHVCQRYGLPQRQRASSLLRHMEIRNVEEEARFQGVQARVFPVILSLSKDMKLLHDSIWLENTSGRVRGGQL